MRCGRKPNNGGIEAMLFDLLRVDLSQFDRRQVPITNALIEQQERSADSIAQWIADSVYKGEIISQLPPLQPGGGFGSNWSTKELYGSYQHWCISQGIRHVETIVVFGRALGKMGLTRGKSNNPPKWYIPGCRPPFRRHPINAAAFAGHNCLGGEISLLTALYPPTSSHDLPTYPPMANRLKQIRFYMVLGRWEDITLTQTEI